MSSPSLALLPCAYDTGKLYSVLPDTGAGDFTVSRNGTATYFDKDGLLKTAQADEPRFEFDPLTGDFKGVLVESAETNLSTNNNTSLFTGVDYTTNTILNNEFGPSINGFYLEHGSGGSVNLAAFRVGSTVNTNLNTNIYTGFIVKNPSGNFMRFLVTGTGGGGVDFNTLTVVDNSTTKIIQISLSTFFIILTNSYSGGSATAQFRCGLTSSITSNTSVSGNFIIGGLNIFLSNTAFSLDKINPIITTGSQVTRPADVIDVTVPSGVTEIKETVNGVENTITSIPTTYQLPNGEVSRVIMT
jgi:hypothetical protein